MLSALRALRILWKSAYVRWLLLLSVLLLLLMDAFDLSLFPRGAVNPDVVGTLGDWFSGMLTVIAVAIAAEALRADRLRADADRQAQEEEVAREGVLRETATARHIREEAGQVYCWLRKAYDRTGTRPVAIELVTVNKTPVPLYHWRVSVESRGDLTSSDETTGPLLPGEMTTTLAARDWSDLLTQDALPRISITFEASNREALRRNFEGDLEICSVDWGPDAGL